MEGEIEVEGAAGGRSSVEFGCVEGRALSEGLVNCDAGSAAMMESDIVGDRVNGR